MIVIIPIILVFGVLAWILRPGKNPSNSRRNSILITVTLSVIVAIAAVVFQLLHNTAGIVEVSDISNTLFIVGLGLIGAYIIASLGFLFAHRIDISKGITFGICIAVFTSVIDLGLLEWLGGV